MLFLVNDGGNSKEFLLANGDTADLQLGHGMATVTLKTASGNLTLNPAGIVVVSDGTDLIVGHTTGIGTGSLGVTGLQVLGTSFDDSSMFFLI